MSNDLSVIANLGSALATLRIREAIRKISSGKKSSFGGGADIALAHKLKAEVLLIMQLV